MKTGDGADDYYFYNQHYYSHQHNSNHHVYLFNTIKSCYTHNNNKNHYCYQHHNEWHLTYMQGCQPCKKVCSIFRAEKK